MSFSRLGNKSKAAAKKAVRQGMSVRDSLMACVRGELPPDFLKLSKEGNLTSAELVNILSSLGYFEPASAHRPSLIEPVNVTKKFVAVAPAPPRSPEDARAIKPDPSGNEVPNGPFSETLALQFCGPMDGVRIVKKVRVLALNRTAQEFGSIEYKHRAFAKSYDLCTQFQHKTKPGTLITLENLILCQGWGFEFFCRNHHLSSEALFEVRTLEWMTK